MKIFNGERAGHEKIEKAVLKKIVRLALDEDLVFQDVTTDSLHQFDKNVRAVIIAKENGTISGLTACLETFRAVDPEIELTVFKSDGHPVKRNDVVVRIAGRQSSILKAERPALNFLQRLSGVATTTKRYVEKTKSTGVTVLDTRKTTPGMRYLEKKAVRDGGAENHRMNLKEMALIKDNHIRMAGSITRAVRAVRQEHRDKMIEVEVKDLRELKEAQELNVDMIMLDNFSPEMVARAVEMKKPGSLFEISGNVTLENIETRSNSGIDFISVGALTHSFKSLDLSLEVLETAIGQGESHE